MADSLIYIPDISGFTNFVNNTEISHAQHIISELLEVIIDANILGMEVSEVEGDAVLFYKLNEVPPVSNIISQTEKLFIAFHAHLKKYNTERICHCGACSNASALSLKVIVHAGEIGFTIVKDKRKPFGPTLVLAHRLLKNDLEENEYLILTDAIFPNKKATDQKLFPWVTLKSKNAEYDGNVVHFNYVPLSSLHDKVPDPAPLPPPAKIPNPVKKEITISKPLNFVFELVTNLDLRLLWRKDINELDYEKNQLNRVGTKHRCLFNGGFADLETIVNDFGDNIMVYGERFTSAPFAKEITFYFILTTNDSGTKIQMEGHYQLKPYWGWIFIPLIRKILNKNMTNTLQQLKSYCDSTDDIVYATI